jgi:hypothetical protein
MDKTLHKLIEPIFRQVLERADGRILMAELRAECLSGLPRISEADVDGALDEMALDHLMKCAAKQVPDQSFS